MTRIVPLLSVTAFAAFLAFGGAAAFAMATGGDGNGGPSGHPGGGPNGPSGPSAGPSGGNTNGPASVTPRLSSCDFRADQMGLDGRPRRDFVWRCEQGGAA